MRRTACIFLIAASAAFGYTRQFVTVSGKTYLPARTDNEAIQFLVNDKIVAGAQVDGKTVFAAGSDPVGAIRAALATWNKVTTAKIHFQPLQTTATGANGQDGKHVFVIGTAADFSALGDALAITLSQFSVTTTTPPGGVATTVVNTTDTDILINPNKTFSTDGTVNGSLFDLQTVMTHELGHSLGANHTQYLSAVLYPTALGVQRVLTTDDIAMVSAIYPVTPVAVGTVNGKITLAGSAVKTSLVTLLDPAGGQTASGYTAADGTFSITVAPGSYAVYAEPFNSQFAAPSVGITDGGAVTTGYQASFLGGVVTPTLTAVAAGATVTLPDLAVTAAASALPVPYVAQGKAGISGDIGTAGAVGLVVSSGQLIDFGFFSPAGSGTTWDASTVVTALGGGVTVQPGTTRFDANVNFGGVKLVRVTLNIPAQTTPTLVTLFLAKGETTVALSGALLVVPAKPILNNVQDAESARTSIVPGSWIAIYGSKLGTSFLDWSNEDFTDGLPKNLDGVTVTFGGIPGSVYYVSDAQIGVQAPGNLPSGPIKVVVSNRGSVSAQFNSTVVQASPSFFQYFANNKYYPAAVHLDRKVIGDPAALAGSEKAHPGETIVMFVNGLAASPAGTIISPPIDYDKSKITLTAGANTLVVGYAGLIFAGEYQLNVTLPTPMASGDYVLKLVADGQSSDSSGIDVILPVAP